MTEEEAMKYPVNVKRKPNKKHKDPVIFYEEGMFCCEGAEADRYKEVVRELKQGKKVAWDGVS